MNENMPENLGPHTKKATLPKVMRALLSLIPLFVFALIAYDIFILISIARTYSPVLVNKLQALNLLPAPEPFTELYLGAYPKTSYGSSISFTFNIHNVTGKDNEYTYLIFYTDDAEKTHLVHEKKVAVKSGENVAITEEFNPPTQRAKTITIELKEEGQSIHFALSTI